MDPPAPSALPRKTFKIKKSIPPDPAGDKIAPTLRLLPKKPTIINGKPVKAKTQSTPVREESKFPSMKELIDTLPVISEEDREVPLQDIAPSIQLQQKEINLPVNVANDNIEEVSQSELGNDMNQIKELETNYNKCVLKCSFMKQELEKLREFEEKRKIEGITLKHDSKLIDLLLQRILDPSEKWKTNIDTLIRIPTSLRGENTLRGGDYFEALFQLAIAINILPQFRNKFIRFYDIKRYKNIYPFPNYLYDKPVLNSGGGEQGISDISFEVSETPSFDVNEINPCGSSEKYECGAPPPPKKNKDNPFYFVSVKGFKEEKAIKSYYDIPLLDQQLKVESLQHITNKNIIICVRNKEMFMTNVKRSKAEFLKNSINVVVGYEELMDAFANFRVSIFNRLSNGDKDINTLVRELYPPDKNVQLPMLSLYYHQELICKAVIRRIKEEEGRPRPHFMCIGVLPRGGKSFIAGGIINQHKDYKQKLEGYNVLFLTSAINETRDQFKCDLIEKFSDFSDFEFVDIVLENGKVAPVRRTVITPKQNGFYFVSRQLTSMKALPGQLVSDENPDSIIGQSDILKRIEKKLGRLPDFDIIFFDEAHQGIGSDTVRANFQKLFERFKVPIILMTATYKKPANVLESLKDLFVWDLNDVKDMKLLGCLTIDQFVEKKPDVLIRYPEIGESLMRERIKNGETETRLAKPYLNFPNPNFISLTFTNDTIRNMIDEGSGYSFIKAFQLTPNTSSIVNKSDSDSNKWGNCLANREHAIRIRQFLTPEQEKEDTFLIGKERKFRALNQIFRIAQDPKNPSRPIQGKPFSMIMFLPTKAANIPIGQLCRVWGSFMREVSYWRNNFVFLTLSVMNDAVISTNMSPAIAVERGICHREDFTNIKDIKTLIREIEVEALKHDKGLVILSGDVAKMGISLPCVDIVCMMSNDSDADDLIQKMYRALTDDPPMKKNGYIIDLDLKRIIRAMFEYDTEKDKLRPSVNHLPSVQERLGKVFELCNWGVDAYIEDNPEKDFTTIMNDVRDLVLNKLQTKIMSDFQTGLKELDKKQMTIIINDPELKSVVIAALRSSPIEATKKVIATTLTERGTIIPDDMNSTLEGPVKSDGATEEPAEPIEIKEPVEEIIDLTSKIRQQQIAAIIKTFVNSLVLKSAESWTTRLNIVSLIAQYDKDKAKYGNTVPACECNTSNECKKVHTNLYEAAFCELRNYAYVSKTGSKPTYNELKHANIMKMVERVFKNVQIALEWNMYIEGLLVEIDKGGDLAIMPEVVDSPVADSSVADSPVSDISISPSSQPPISPSSTESLIYVGGKRKPDFTRKMRPIIVDGSRRRKSATRRN